MLKIFSSNFLQSLIHEAKCSKRKRIHYNIHKSSDEKCQRLMNAIGTDSYIAPHRHQIDPKSECLIAAKGLFAAIIFSDDGVVKQIECFGSEKYKNVNLGLELPSGTWHTVLALKEGSILFEVKEGPFDSSKAKEYAPWAPPEETIESRNYLCQLRELCERSLVENFDKQTLKTFSLD
jgi:cupin fold WbuC family metalloprotein